jgi:ABC-type iron transport system FetAB permease component
MSWVILIAALIVAFLLLGWAGRVVRASIGTAIALLILVLVLQFVFGITPADLWEQLVQLWNNVWRSIGR